MRCVPKQKNRKIGLIVISFIVIGALLYMIPLVCNAYEIKVIPWIFQFAALALIVGGIYVLMRYKLTEFVYEIRLNTRAEENTDMIPVYASEVKADIARVSPEYLDFAVMRAQGTRIKAMECLLCLKDLVRVIPLSHNGQEGRETKQSVRKKYEPDGFVFYDYTVTPMTDEALELIFIEGNRYVGVIIEPDLPMREYFMGLGKTSVVRGNS